MMQQAMHGCQVNMKPGELSFTSLGNRMFLRQYRPPAQSACRPQANLQFAGGRSQQPPQLRFSNRQLIRLNLNSF
jgi:hypothetical protein